MKGIGYIVLFWFNMLGLHIAWKYLFGDGGGAVPGIAMLNFFVAISRLILLLVLSFLAIASESTFRRSWIYLAAAAPTACLIAVAVTCARPEGM